MNDLELVRFGRQHFNEHSAIQIPQHKLEVWPGFVEYLYYILVFFKVYYYLIKVWNTPYVGLSRFLMIYQFDSLYNFGPLN